jgi:hypothetical protein
VKTNAILDKQLVYDENSCARIFLEWLSSQQEVVWTFRRAEEEFRELANQTRWEFVARPADGSDRWIALEVKRLVVPHGEQQAGDWRSLIDDVSEKLKDSLQERYLLADLPKYTFDQLQRKTLVHCLATAVTDVAPNLQKGEWLDIGPNVAKCFSEWPKETRKQPVVDLVDPHRPRLMYPPHKLLLWKSSDVGSSLAIGGGPMIAYWAEPALNKAVLNLLEGKGKANAQLRLAKGRGASKTVLLLDERIDFDPQVVAQTISQQDGSLLSNIDEVYLVSTFSGEHVQQVWTSAAGESARMRTAVSE